jgi:hypothetical protein
MKSRTENDCTCGNGTSYDPAGAELSPIDESFVGVPFISTSSTFADSYTTPFARQNWLTGKQGVCNVEVQSAYLYGKHPMV